MFIGRETELNDLDALYHQDKFQLFILYGRRRIGKTTFLREFCKGKPSIFYSAEQSNEKLNLEKFSAQIFEYYGEKNLEPFSSWENLILYVHNRQLSQPLVLVFDEFPYLAAANPAILSMLQHMADGVLKEGRLFIVLCGSYMGFMEKEVLGAKSPLFGRRTGQLHMKPFDYKTSMEFLRGFSDEEKLALYGAFGGTAMYLEQIRPELTFKENVLNLFMKPTGYLYEEPQLLIRQEVQEPGVYNAVIEAIAGGASRSAEIASKTGEESAKCLKYINTLCELGIIYKETPFGDKPGSRKTIYNISDFMFRFWYRYIAANRTLLETGAQEAVWKLRIEPDMSVYMGHVFEIICRDFMLRKNSAGGLPLLFNKIGRWWGTDPRTKRQAEIDLVASDGKNYIFGECKWRNEKLDLAVLQNLKEKSALFRSRTENAWYALFSKSGFTSAIIEAAEKDERLLLFDMNDLLK